ncbi:MAG: glycosyltransferase family 4 protein [Candidatus Margulisiibacteriota bacterium]
MEDKKRKLKIAVWHNLGSGGAKRHLYDLIKCLLKKGHHAEAWCPQTADKNYKPLKDLIKEHTTHLDVKPFLAKKNAFNLYSLTQKKMSAMEEHCKECADQIERGSFDVLYSGSCIFFRVTRIGKYSSIPSVLNLQEPMRKNYEAIFDLPWAGDGPGPKFSKMLRVLPRAIKMFSASKEMTEERNNAACFDRVLANSLYSRESILRAYGIESTFVPLGIDKDLFVRPDVARKSYLVGIGRVDHLKGIDRVIRAVGTIDKAVRPELIWVGDTKEDDYKTRMEALADSSGVKLGFKIAVSDSELIKTVSSAALMVYAPRLEPFGLAPLEAGALGTPVISLAEGGVRESIKDGVNGVLVSESSPQTFGRAIMELLDNTEKLKRLSETSREYVINNWEINISADRTEEILIETADKGKTNG